MSNDVDDGRGSSDAVVEERVVSFLQSDGRPRHVASDVAEALDLTRGRVRTGLQTLADEGRVVRTDEGTTARWAVPDRAEEPDAAPDTEEDVTTAPGDGGVTGAADEGATGSTSKRESVPEPESESAPEPEPEPRPERASAATVGRPGVEERRRGVGEERRRGVGEERRRGVGVVRVAAVVLGLAAAGVALSRLGRRR